MRTRGRPVAALVALAALGLLAGACSSGGGSSSGTHITLRMAMWTNPPAIDFVKQFNKEFEAQHPGVTVQLTDAPTANGAWSTLYNTVTTGKTVDLLADYPRMPGEIPPASTGIDPGVWPQVGTNHQFIDLANQPFMKDYNQQYEQLAMGVNGKIYGLMVATTAPNGLYYKKALLDKYHLSAPTTFSQFISELATLKSHSITPVFAYGEAAGFFPAIAQELLMQGHSASEASDIIHQWQQGFYNGSQGWNHALYQQAGARYQQIIKYLEPNASGVQQLNAPPTWAANANDFAFYLDGSWAAAQIQSANPSLDFGFIPIPGTDNPAANQLEWNGDLTWEVPTWSKHQAVAEEWLAMFSQRANYQKWLDALGGYPLQPGTTDNAKGMDWLSAHVADAPLTIPGPWLPSTGAAADAGFPDFTKVTPFGSQSMSQVLAQAQRDYQSAVKKK
jgi:raffinose/stachyose/melibiose transport system substrate-binding protein